MTRRRPLASIIASLVFALAASLLSAAERPNVVLIVSDDQGYHDLGVLDKEVISPNLDRLAREGVRLTNFYVAWPACTPSRGAFLTGRYPQRNGIYDMIRNEAPDYGYKYPPEEYAVTWERIGGMDEREVLLPEMLKGAGGGALSVRPATGSVSATDVDVRRTWEGHELGTGTEGATDGGVRRTEGHGLAAGSVSATDVGVRRTEGYRLAVGSVSATDGGVRRTEGYRSAIFGKWDLGMHRRYLPLQRGFDEFYGFVNTGIDYFTHERYGVPSMYSGNAPTEQDRGTYCTYLFEREAARFVRENKDRPFFLYLPFNAPHGASNLDPSIRGAAQAPEEFKKLFPHLKDEYQTAQRYGEPAKVPSKSKRRLEYLASIACMDSAIGTVLNLLDEYELADHTLVIFFSDNGGSGGASNEPLRGHKGQTFEGGIRVCAIVRGPGIPAGTVCDEFLTSMELVPTITNFTGAAPPEGVVLDGYDMLPVLRGETKSPRETMFWKRRDWEAARVGEWKWVRRGDEQFLFNLAEDVGEEKNLIDRHPEQAAVMREHFSAWQEEMEAAEPRGPFRDY